MRQEWYERIRVRKNRIYRFWFRSDRNCPEHRHPP
ncbi:conserved hypothetical protein [Enterococcus faecium 1,231,501]|nr:conserved hypothetical protein [Enterococcus faecium 1,230,933]EEV46824.1 conserved hypothetical protein [Enterococcus faecium 1,231,501]